MSSCLQLTLGDSCGRLGGQKKLSHSHFVHHTRCHSAASSACWRETADGPGLFHLNRDPLSVSISLGPGCLKSVYINVVQWKAHTEDSLVLDSSLTSCFRCLLFIKKQNKTKNKKPNNK
uniref:Uncharacterized protein n=1 Tax=Rousettus aegyptiacus TaxID=9407 RepID=A0A7J8BSX3_ROUAE|nr:hypothetical protein HJG63_009612 [Rousettus aegyptiacus]